MLAALFGAPGYLRWLLDAGADLYANDYHGWTPLHFATLAGGVKSMNVLLAVVPQINVSKKDMHGWTRSPCRCQKQQPKGPQGVAGHAPAPGSMRRIRRA